MELYFLRHGIAADPREWGRSADAERPLTEEGVARLSEAAAGMRRMKLQFDRVFSSPLVRAVETARLALKGLGSASPIELTDALTPDAGFSEFLSLLPKEPSNGRWLFVGHQPSIGEFAGRLFLRDKEASLDFKKGSLARIDAGPAEGGYSGALVWMMTQNELAAKT